MYEKVLILLISLSFLRGFFANNFTILKYSWDIMLFITQLFWYGNFIKIIKHKKKLMLHYIIFIIGVLISTLISVLNLGFLILKNNILQFFYINAFIVILINVKYGINKNKLNSIWKELYFFSSIQILFDIYRYKSFSFIEEIYDNYPGSMYMPNQKSRFLLLMIILSIYYLKNYKKYKNFQLINIFGMIISYIIGFSELTYIIAGISLIYCFLKLKIKDIFKIKKFKKYTNLYLIILIILFIYFLYLRIIKAPNLMSMIIIAKDRFFNNEHGVFAVYLYSIKLCTSSIFMGIGGGTFMGRAATMLGSLILDNSPSVAVVYGTLSVNKSTVDGFSSFMNLLTEYGLLGFIGMIGIIKTIFNNENNKLHPIITLFSVTYIFLLMNYIPYFFDNEFGYLIMISYIVFQRLFI